MSVLQAGGGQASAQLPPSCSRGRQGPGMALKLFVKQHFADLQVGGDKVLAGYQPLTYLVVRHRQAAFQEAARHCTGT